MHAGAGGTETTVERFVMPDDSDFVLQQDATFTLPVRDAGPIDIAAATSLLWMVVPVDDSHQVRRNSVGQNTCAGSRCDLTARRRRHCGTVDGAHGVGR